MSGLRNMSDLQSRWRTDPLTRAVRLLDVNWRRVAGAVGLGSLALGSAIGLAAVSAWLIARASQMPPVLTLSLATVAVRAFGIGRGVFRYLERLASHDIALRGMASLRTNLYTALAKGRAQALVSLRRGDLLARVGTDVDAVGDLVVRSLIPAGVALVVSLGSIVLVGAFLPAAGITLFAGLVLAAVISPWLAARSARVVEARGAAARAAMSATSLEILESAGPLAVSGRMGAELDALRHADRDLAQVNDDGGRISGLGAGLAQLAIGLSAFAALWFGIPAVVSGSLAPVELSVIVLTPLAVFEAATVLPQAAVQWHRSRNAAVRLMAMLDAVEPGAGAGPAGATGPGAAEAPITTPAQAPSLMLRDVSCGWPGAGKVVVRGLDLDVRPGRAVALVGPSGIGKTTALMTAAGLIPPVAGSVTLDRRPVAALGSTAAGSVVFVAEDGHVFDTSVLENLRVARGNVTPEDARTALEQVGLGLWVSGLADGVDTVLGADATTISGGERRRLLLARALLAPAPLLLVDEPAEHLDPQTADALVTELVAQARGGARGVVVATHRLSALDQVDEVLLLGAPDGPGAQEHKVIARGPHEQLLANSEYRWALEQESALT